MQFFDALTLDGRRTTRDGYLVADARAARTGIQVYLGSEVGKPEMARVRVYRPEDEVFDQASMGSYAHKPITNDHPAEAVTSKNWARHARGFVGDSVARDGECVRIPLMLADAAAIADLDAGKRELSAGYSCDLDWTPGTTSAGEAYDAVQRNIRINHVALVDAGRAGSACRIGDRSPQASDQNGGRQMSGTNLKTVTVDGIPIETTDQAASVIGTLQQRLADAVAKALTGDAALTTAKAEHAKALEAKDAAATAARVAHEEAVKAKDAAIADLTAKLAAVDSTLEARIEERLRVVADASRVAGKAVDAKGKTTAAIRREAIATRLGDAFAKDKPDEAIAQQFDAIVAVLPPVTGATGRDPLADAMRGLPGATADAQPHVKAHAAYLDHLANGWKPAA